MPDAPVPHPSSLTPSLPPSLPSSLPSSLPLPPPVYREVRSSAEQAARRRLIDAIARELRKAHWDQVTLPVNAWDMAEGAGVEVRTRGGTREPGYPYRGRLLYLDGRPVIELNDDEDPLRQRLVLAHALGHHVLGHGPVPPELPPTLTVANPRPIEQEAQHFALELLMPDFVVQRLMNQGVINARKLGDLFLLPEGAVRERLQALHQRCDYL